MPTAAIAGTSGTCTITGHNGRFVQWQVTSAQDVHDTTGFGASSNYRTNIGGLKGWTLEASGYLVQDAASTAPVLDYSATLDATGVACTLVGTGATYSGTAILSGGQAGLSVNGVGTFRVTAVGTGVLTETWDQSG